MAHSKSRRTTEPAVLVDDPRQLALLTSDIAQLQDRAGDAEMHYLTAVRLRPDFIEALPRNASGKLLKRVLREPYWALQAEAALGAEACWPIQYGYAVKRRAK